MGFKAEFTVDKFEDFKELTSLGTKVVEVPVEVPVEVIADLICSECGEKLDISHAKKNGYMIFKNDNEQETESYEIECSHCASYNHVHKSLVEKK